MSNLYINDGKSSVSVGELGVLFGKQQVMLGSLERDFILRTAGNIKVQVGNKMYDLPFTTTDSTSGTSVAINSTTSVIATEADLATLTYPGDGSFVYVKADGAFYIAEGGTYILVTKTAAATQTYWLSYHDTQTLTGTQKELVLLNTGSYVASLSSVGTLGANDVFANQIIYSVADGIHYRLVDANNPYATTNWQPIYLSLKGGLVKGGVTIDVAAGTTQTNSALHITGEYQQTKLGTLTTQSSVLSIGANDYSKGAAIWTYNGNTYFENLSKDSTVGFKWLTKSTDGTVNNPLLVTNNSVGIGGSINTNYRLSVAGAALFSTTATVTQGLLSPDFVSGPSGVGFSLSKDSSNLWTLEVDQVIARLTTKSSLTMFQTSSINGSLIANYSLTLSLVDYVEDIPIYITASVSGKYKTNTGTLRLLAERGTNAYVVRTSLATIDTATPTKEYVNIPLVYAIGDYFGTTLDTVTTYNQDASGTYYTPTGDTSYNSGSMTFTPSAGGPLLLINTIKVYYVQTNSLATISVGDLLYYKQWDENKNYYSSIYAQVVLKNSTGYYIYVYDGQILAAGQKFIKIGNTAATASMLQVDSADLNNPYLDVYDGMSTFAGFYQNYYLEKETDMVSTYNKEDSVIPTSYIRLRIGDLTNISDTNLLLTGASIRGIYSDNAYLKGNFTINNAYWPSMPTTTNLSDYFVVLEANRLKQINMATKFAYWDAKADNTITITATGNGITGGGNLMANRTIALDFTYLDSRYVDVAGSTMTGPLILNADPTATYGAATKNYVDNLVTGIVWSEADTSSTTSLTLSGEQTIDGFTTSASRVALLDGSANAGVWISSTGAWTRATDANTGTQIAKLAIIIKHGTVRGNTQWVNSNAGTITLGTTAITFVQIAGFGTYTNGTGITLTANVFALDTTYTDGRYLKLSGGTMSGQINSQNIVPLNGNSYTLGSPTNPFIQTYAGTANAGNIIITGGASQGGLLIEGTSSNGVNIQVATTIAAGGYIFTLPNTGGTSGYVLTSSGGTTTPMTWTNITGTYVPYTGALTAVNLGTNTLQSGDIGIGAAPLTHVGLNISGTRPATSGSSHQILAQSTYDSTTTLAAVSFYSAPSTAAAVYTLANAYGFRADGTVIGSGSTVTAQQAFYVHSTFTTATSNFGFRGAIPSGTNNYNLYMDGTAQNYLNGNVGIGVAPVSTTGLTVGSTASILINANGTLNTATSYSINTSPTLTSAVTTAAYIYRATPSTQAATFTLASLYNFLVDGVNVGSGSTVSNQYGFLANSGMTGATNNYGFFGNIPSGTGRWNLYMGGTAQNYLGANLLINGSTANNSFIQFQAATTAFGFIGSEVNAGGSASNFMAYTYGANSYSIWTNGSKQFVVDSTGNIGLGFTPAGGGGNATTIEGDNGGQIAFRVAANTPQTYISSNIVGTPYSGTRQVVGYAAQMYLDGYGGTMGFRRAAAGAAGTAISLLNNMNFDVNGNVLFDSTSSGSSTTPLSVSLGSSLGSNTAGNQGNIKLRVWDNGTAYYGIGISSALMEFQVPSGAGMSFFVGGVASLNLASNGNASFFGSSLNVYKSGASTGISVGSSVAGKTYVSLSTSADAGGYGSLQSISASGSTYGSLAINSSGGNVLIGTATDSTGSRLQVNGMITTGAPSTTKGTGSVADSSVVGIQSVFATSAASGFQLGIYSYAEQTAATTGSIQALEGQAFASHTSGTVAVALATIGNIQINGSGGVTTWARSVQGGGFVNAGTVTNWARFYAGAGSGAAGVTNNYSFYSESSAGIGYFADGLQSGASVTGTTFVGNHSSFDDRTPGLPLPTTYGQQLRLSFATSANTGTGGNYAGVMTYAPWTGTTASTGDASYQLAFGSTATNGAGVPQLRIRKGIDSTWNSWYDILTSVGGQTIGGNLTVSGSVILSHIMGNTGTPTIAAGASTVIGTSPTLSVSGTDLGGTITITTGTSVTGTGLLATITFNVAYGSAPRGIVLSPANTNASITNGSLASEVFVPAAGQTNGVTTTTFCLQSQQSLQSSTTFLWAYHVVQ